MKMPPATVRSLVRSVPGARALAQIFRQWFDRDHAAVTNLMKRRDIAVFQPWPTTGPDRYPQLFDRLAEDLSALETPRVLSFGCSSGEEIAALRRRLPHARITGIDVNRRALVRARSADDSELTTLKLADRPDPADSYDAVLALAVLRHGFLGKQRPASSADVLPFTSVAEGVARLDAALEPGGLLAITYSHYRFADMPAAIRYESVSGDLGIPPSSPVYGPDERLIEGGEYSEVLFRKLG